MNRWIEKIKERWGVSTLWQVALILFIFAITGMSSLFVKNYIFELLGINSDTPFWLRSIVWVGTVFPSYQLLFLFYGFILGQLDFVWRFEKNTFKKIKRLFG